MKLLIVDDSPQMRHEVKLFLKDLAEQIDECDDGARALAAYAAQQPDWVLMDIKMAEVDGLTATRQIKAAHPEARIMILTGYDDADLRVAARNAGACEYITKENLLEVRRILGSPNTSC
jgi:DNA-binding NarL/FixJ family response regulator